MKLSDILYTIKNRFTKQTPVKTGTIDEKFVDSLKACTPEQQRYIGMWLQKNYCNIEGLDYTPITLPNNRNVSYK